MKQSDVLMLLNELGGTATTKEILELALKKFPELKPYRQNIKRELWRLEKWGDVTFDNKFGNGYRRDIIWSVTK